jgi:murein DD-endopeptidase MepM/ murein hydrolase activator NlpD
MYSQFNRHLLIWLCSCLFPPLISTAQFNSLGRHTQKAAIPNAVAKAAQQKYTSTEEHETSSQELKVERMTFHPPLEDIHITSAAGWRMHPVSGQRKIHNGIDLRARYDSVYAVMVGIVESLGYDDRSGNWVRIAHDENYRSSYAHLSRILVSMGEKVNAGQVIAISGNTGSSSGPHLHFRIIVSDK